MLCLTFYQFIYKKTDQACLLYCLEFIFPTFLYFAKMESHFLLISQKIFDFLNQILGFGSTNGRAKDLNSPHFLSPSSKASPKPKSSSNATASSASAAANTEPTSDDEDKNTPPDQVKNPSIKNLCTTLNLPGRRTNQTEFIQKKLLPALLKHKMAWPFCSPVDPEALRIPDYYKIIKHPMDLREAAFWENEILGLWAACACSESTGQNLKKPLIRKKSKNFYWKHKKFKNRNIYKNWRLKDRFFVIWPATATNFELI